MQTVEQLCPFCGANGELIERHNPMSKWKWSVDCASSTCGMSGPVESSSASAIAAWNTRFEASLPPSAPVDAERERGPRCESCLKPVEVGQVVLCYDDAGEMHADCEHPYSTKHDQRDGEPAPVVLLGEPMVHVPLSALALPPSGIAEMWQPIETAPRDGSWFMIINAEASDDSPEIEVGAYDPLKHNKFVEVEGGLYRKEVVSAYDWRGFNNFGRATHWRTLPAPPVDLSNKGVG